MLFVRTGAPRPLTATLSMAWLTVTELISHRHSTKAALLATTSIGSSGSSDWTGTGPIEVLRERALVGGPRERPPLNMRVGVVGLRVVKVKVKVY